MTALDDLQSGASSTKEGLNNSAAAAAKLERGVEELAQQNAALGNRDKATILSGSAKGRLSTVRDLVGQAQKALDDFMNDCEQVKGTGG